MGKREIPPQEFEMLLAPSGDVIVVVAIRNGAANDQQQNLRQRMQAAPDIARIVDRGKMFQSHREV